MANCYIRRRKHTGSEPPVSIVSWQNGTDAEIAAMVAAADAGKIKLSDYWNVGDEREVSLSAMSATGVGESHVAQTGIIVLMHQGLYKDVNDKTVNYVVGMKNCLKEKGYMNSTGTAVGSWHSSARRSWCNNTFYSAIPSTLRSIFKQFKTKTASEGDGTTIKTSYDYIAMFAEREIMGDISNNVSNNTEFANLRQIDYYATSSNRQKKLGTATTATGWWTRSPSRSYNNQRFCYIMSTGSNSQMAANSTSLAISPFGCI